MFKEEYQKWPWSDEFTVWQLQAAYLTTDLMTRLDFELKQIREVLLPQSRCLRCFVIYDVTSQTYHFFSIWYTIWVYPNTRILVYHWTCRIVSKLWGSMDSFGIANCFLLNKVGEGFPRFVPGIKPYTKKLHSHYLYTSTCFNKIGIYTIYLRLL